MVGEAKPKECIASFTLPYQSGTLHAEAVGAEGVSPVQLSTAGEPVRIRLLADKRRMRANGQDLVYVTAEVIDANGQVCPNDSSLLTFSLSGNATLQAVGNADIKSLEPYVGNTHKAWKGRACAVIRGGKKSGNVTLHVTGKGREGQALRSQDFRIQVVK
jgi:beta-galactosidase